MLRTKWGALPRVQFKLVALESTSKDLQSDVQSSKSVWTSNGWQISIISQPRSPLCRCKYYDGTQEMLASNAIVCTPEPKKGCSTMTSRCLCVSVVSSTGAAQWQPALLAILGPSIGFWSSPAVEVQQEWSLRTLGDLGNTCQRLSKYVGILRLFETYQLMNYDL